VAAGVTLSPGLERAIGLLDPARRPRKAAVPDGYLDLLGGAGRRGGRPAQRLMLTRGLPVVYERWWRPAWGRVLMGPLGPGTKGERQIAHELLELGPGDTVLDIACGPGNFTRAFARASFDGLAVGLDASRTMLDQAAREQNPPNVRYVRGNAAALPFPDATFDAVCCFAALYFIAEPYVAIDEMVRVLAPGGRLALLSSVSRGPVPAGDVDAVVRPLSGTRIFGPNDLTGALQERGMTAIDRRLAGLAQFVSARAPR
jgi:SAM-dependent methyltransferase